MLQQVERWKNKTNTNEKHIIQKTYILCIARPTQIRKERTIESAEKNNIFSSVDK